MNLVQGRTMRGPANFHQQPGVFLVDADASVRQATARLISAAGWQPRAMSSAEEFLASPRELRKCCLLLDLHLPGLSGLELQRRVADRPEMPVVFMSKRADIRSTVHAMRAGAFEFLTKSCAKDELRGVIEQALTVSQNTLQAMSEHRALCVRRDSLSEREREVMNRVVTGRLNKQIGGDLGISEITVKAHRGNVMRKMSAGSLAELVNMAAALSAAAWAKPKSNRIADARLM
jgi:FixJ family two-component response regulator